LRTMSIELCMTLILPDPLAIGASELNHVKTVAINTIYQNLSQVTSDRYVIFDVSCSVSPPHQQNLQEQQLP